jgi:hypothetical protein
LHAGGELSLSSSSSVYTALQAEIPLDEAYEEASRQSGIDVEQIALMVTLERFEPLAKGLLTHINEKSWTDILRALDARVQPIMEEDPSTHFTNWGVNLLPHLVPARKEMIAPMVSLDPAQRPSMQQILKHPAWNITN